MSNYYLILIWVAVFAFLSMCVGMKRIEYVGGKKVQRFTPLWAFILFLPLIIWSGYRGHVGDTGIYMLSFEEMPLELNGIQQYMTGVEKDEGFYFLSALIKSIIGNHVEIYLIIIAAIQIYFLIRLYRKYSTNFVLSVFLFLVSTDYVSWIFNGMRQFTAVTLTLLCFEFMLEKKYISAVVVALIASLFHGSALLIIPFIFIAQGQAWNARTLLFIIAVMIAISFVGEFTTILDTVLAETQYENVVSDWQSWEDDGTNSLRVLVYAIPTILSLIGLRYIKDARNPIINICVNMSIVSVGFYIISMFTSGIFIGRLPIYFSL